jgi:hypothetical protein
MKICCGCGLRKKLIEAHIVPRGFARQIMGDQKHNVKISMDRVGATHHGVYDNQILCQDCDGKLGGYDDYALDVCRRFQEEHSVGPDGMFEIPNVDGDKFATFILSVLWRASISSRYEFRKVSLGPFESRAHDVLFGNLDLVNMRDYELIVGRFINAPIRTENFYTSPARTKMLDLNAWHFALSGFKILAKMDQRKLPHELQPVIVNGNDTLRGQFVDYMASTEHETFRDMVLAHRNRVPRR